MKVSFNVFVYLFFPAFQFFGFSQVIWSEDFESYSVGTGYVSSECKALVFIKYNRIGENKILKISKIKALEYFIPDSWISPKKENVSVFLDWVFSLPCYVLSYSDNEQLVLLIDKLNNNEV